MEIVKYKPRYKKAILDLVNKKNTVEGTDIIVKGNLEHPDNVCYCAFENRKFKGAIMGIRKNMGVLVNYWVSTDLSSGTRLLREAMFNAKLDGFKYALFYRETEQKFYKKEL